MNKITLVLGTVIVVTTALALTPLEKSMTQHALGAGNSSSVGKDNPTQMALSNHPPCPNEAKSTAGNNTNSTAGNNTNSTAGNSSHIVKSDLLFSRNDIVRIAYNNPTLEPISSSHPCGNGAPISGKYVSGNIGSGNIGIGNSGDNNIGD